MTTILAGPCTFSLVETVGPNRQLRIEGNLTPGMSQAEIFAALSPVTSAIDRIAAIGAIDAFEEKGRELAAKLREYRGLLDGAEKTFVVAQSKDRQTIQDKQMAVTEGNNVLRWRQAVSDAERVVENHALAVAKVKAVASGEV